MRRGLLVVAGGLLLGIAAGGAYLALAPKRYVAVSNLIVEQPAAPGDPVDADLLEKQAELLRSSDVLRLADKDGDLGRVPTLARATDPVPVVKRNLRVEASPRRNVLGIAYASTSREDAVRIVDLVVDAYRAYQSDARQRRASELATSVEARRATIDARLAEARQALARFEAGFESDARGGGEASTRRAASLADALTRTQLETFAARRAYDEAIADAGPALAGLDDRQLEETLRGSAAIADGDGGEIAAQEVLALSRQLAELRKTYSENHPSVVRAVQRLGQMRLSKVAGTRQRWQAAQARELALGESLDAVQSQVSAATTRAAERERLAAEAERYRGQADELDRQLTQIALAQTGGSLSIRVDSPAATDDPAQPPLPRTLPTLTTSALLGLLVAGLAALVAEYRAAGSLRHLTPIRSAVPTAGDAGEALGLRVLGDIPAAEGDEAASPEAIAFSAHRDAFGPIANGVRELRVAMEVDGRLPATILLTAAGDGQGTTTLATNLAMTIVRENRKVLLVDLHVASPATATLFGLDPTRGLVELLADGNAVELIRPTDVPRLDVLPAGTPPTDLAAVLNTDRFAELLAMLAGAYDHVVFDAPPLSRGDDARIVASLCDGTVLVCRPSRASLRRAAGARDLLLTIGANLVGVALTPAGVTVSKTTTAPMTDA